MQMQLALFDVFVASQLRAPKMFLAIELKTTTSFIF